MYLTIDLEYKKSEKYWKMYTAIQNGGTYETQWGSNKLAGRQVL